MDFLSGTRVYLSGAIDRIPDDGVQWRNYLKKRFIEENFDIKVFDPCDKPKHLGSETGLEKHKVKNLIKEGKWEEARKFVSAFRHFDLRAIDWCDFVIAKIDINIHACGTYDEIFLAEREHKPIFIVMGEGQKKTDIPSWLVAFINEDEIFESEEECIDHLIKINKKEIKVDERWVKID